MNQPDPDSASNPYLTPGSELLQKESSYDVSAAKLYREWHVALAAFIGLALGAFWVISRNARTLGQPDDARTLVLIGFAAQVGLIILSFLLPEQISGVVFSVVVAVAAYHFTGSLQGAAITNHEQQGGVFYSGWRAAGAGLCWLLFLVLIVGSLVFLSLTFAPDTVGEFLLQNVA